MKKLLTVLCGIALVACTKTKQSVEPATGPEGAGANAANAEQSAVPATRDEAIRALVANFERAYFDFDSSDLTGGAKDALKTNAAILTKYNDIQVEVQGHADNRGTTEYNIALGQKRAESVRNYLLRSGVAQDRIVLISFGKEKPLVPGTSETAWSKNRRAEFRVVTAQTPVKGTTD